MSVSSSLPIPELVSVFCYAPTKTKSPKTTAWEKVLAKAGDQYDQVTHLDLCDCEIKNKIAKIVADRLGNYTSLTSLSLTANPFSRNGLIALLEGLRGHKSLTTLELNDNEIEDDGINILKNHCIKYPGLTSLDLRWTDFSCYHEIGSLIDQYPLLKHIGFSTVKSIEGLDRLIRSLSHNTTLTSLDMDTYRVNEIEGVAVVSLLETNTTLQKIKFPYICEQQITINRLIGIIQQQNFLVEISLASNKMEKTQAILLADALKSNIKLESLVLSSASLGCEAGKAFAEALLHNNTLRSLDLSRNPFLFHEAGAAIGNALITNSTLTELNLYETGLSWETAKIFNKVLSVNTTLFDLNLGYNGLGNKGIISILNSLENNQSLKIIDLSNCSFFEITSDTKLAFTQMLSVNTSLESIRMNELLLDLESSLNILNHMHVNPNLIEKLPFDVCFLEPHMISQENCMRYRSILVEGSYPNTFSCVIDVGAHQQKILDRNLHNKKMKTTSLYELLLPALNSTL